MSMELRKILEHVRETKRPARIFTSGTVSAGGLPGLYVINTNFEGMDETESQFFGLTTSKSYSIGTIMDISDEHITLELARFKRGFLSTVETQRRIVLVPFTGITGVEI